MKKILFSIFILLFSINLLAQKNIYQFKVKDINGKTFDFSSLKGKKILIVNTASRCGLTGQYKDLQTLYEMYRHEGFEIVAFPANNFLKQEPGENSEIKEFCKKNYDISFLLMSKISVKGKHQHPIYSWLTSKEMNGKMDSKVKWNFQKYLINENGELVDVIYPTESPTGKKISQWLKE